MRIVLIFFLFPFLCDAKEKCSPSVIMSMNGLVNVTSGQRFNLTCSFTCLTVDHRVQLKKNQQLLTELSLSRDSSEFKHTIILFLLIPTIQQNDAGQYRCQTDPVAAISSVKVNVVCTNEYMGKVNETVPDAVISKPTCEVKSTCITFSWNAPLWYLLCKTVFFLVCSLSVVLKKTC